MDPTDVLRAIWQQRRYVAPTLLVALVAVAYVFQFAPRSYESTATYALVNPAVPTQEQLDTDPELEALNADNPYLRSTDANLVTDAVIARLGAPSTVKALDAAGVGTEFTAGPGAGGNGFVIDITGVGPTPEASIATTAAVGDVLQRELHDLQTVNGADDRYLFTPLLITPAEDATEKFSSRLRAVIVVLIGGAVLVFGAVSLGRFVDRTRGRRRAAGPGRSDESGPSDGDGVPLRVDEIVPTTHEQPAPVARPGPAPAKPSIAKPATAEPAPAAQGRTRTPRAPATSPRGSRAAGASTGADTMSEVGTTPTPRSPRRPPRAGARSASADTPPPDGPAPAPVPVQEPTSKPAPDSGPVSAPVPAADRPARRSSSSRAK